MDANELIKDRINAIWLSKGCSIKRFAESMGLNQKTIDQQIKGERKISLHTLFAVLSSFEDISAEWLLRGEGDMLKEKAVISNINNNIHSQNAHNINNGSGNINETQASSSEIIELLKQQNATLTQQVASLTELVKNITTK